MRIAWKEWGSVAGVCSSTRRPNNAASKEIRIDRKVDLERWGSHGQVTLPMRKTVSEETAAVRQQRVSWTTARSVKESLLSLEIGPVLVMLILYGKDSHEQSTEDGR